MKEEIFLFQQVIKITILLILSFKIENIEIKDRKIKEDFFYNLSAQDSFYLEECYKSIIIGPKVVNTFKCPECGSEYELRYPVDIRLFCNNPSSKNGNELNGKIYRSILNEQLDLAEFGHITYTESDNMYVFEKDAVYNLIFERLDKRNKELEKKRGNAAVV